MIKRKRTKVQAMVSLLPNFGCDVEGRWIRMQQVINRRYKGSSSRGLLNRKFDGYY